MPSKTKELHDHDQLSNAVEKSVKSVMHDQNSWAVPWAYFTFALLAVAIVVVLVLIGRYAFQKNKRSRHKHKQSTRLSGQEKGQTQSGAVPEFTTVVRKQPAQKTLFTPVGSSAFVDSEQSQTRRKSNDGSTVINKTNRTKSSPKALEKAPKMKNFSSEDLRVLRRIKSDEEDKEAGKTREDLNNLENLVKKYNNTGAAARPHLQQKQKARKQLTRKPVSMTDDVYLTPPESNTSLEQTRTRSDWAKRSSLPHSKQKTENQMVYLPRSGSCDITQEEKGNIADMWASLLKGTTGPKAQVKIKNSEKTTIAKSWVMPQEQHAREKIKRDPKEPRNQDPRRGSGQSDQMKDSILRHSFNGVVKRPSEKRNSLPKYHSPPERSTPPPLRRSEECIHFKSHCAECQMTRLARTAAAGKNSKFRAKNNQRREFQTDKRADEQTDRHAQHELNEERLLNELVYLPKHEQQMKSSQKQPRNAGGACHAEDLEPRRRPPDNVVRIRRPPPQELATPLLHSICAKAFIDNDSVSSVSESTTEVSCVINDALTAISTMTLSKDRGRSNMQTPNKKHNTPPGGSGRQRRSSTSSDYDTPTAQPSSTASAERATPPANITEEIVIQSLMRPEFIASQSLKRGGSQSWDGRQPIERSYSQSPRRQSAFSPSPQRHHRYAQQHQQQSVLRVVPRIQHQDRDQDVPPQYIVPKMPLSNTLNAIERHCLPKSPKHASSAERQKLILDHGRRLLSQESTPRKLDFSAEQVSRRSQEWMTPEEGNSHEKLDYNERRRSQLNALGQELLRSGSILSSPRPMDSGNWSGALQRPNEEHAANRAHSITNGQNSHGQHQLDFAPQEFSTPQPGPLVPKFHVACPQVPVRLTAPQPKAPARNNPFFCSPSSSENEDTRIQIERLGPFPSMIFKQ